MSRSISPGPIPPRGLGTMILVELPGNAVSHLGFFCARFVFTQHRTQRWCRTRLALGVVWPQSEKWMWSPSWRYSNPRQGKLLGRAATRMGGFPRVLMRGVSRPSRKKAAHRLGPHAKWSVATAHPFSACPGFGGCCGDELVIGLLGKRELELRLPAHDWRARRHP